MLKTKFNFCIKQSLHKKNPILKKTSFFSPFNSWIHFLKTKQWHLKSFHKIPLKFFNNFQLAFCQRQKDEKKKNKYIIKNNQTDNHKNLTGYWVYFMRWSRGCSNETFSSPNSRIANVAGRTSFVFFP